MKMINNETFFPAGKGITPLGEEVIVKALEKPYRILIDIKHISLKSRLQYYEMLEKDGFLDIPIIASHSGIAGVSYRFKPVLDYLVIGNLVEVHYFQPKGIVEGTSFNPWSINLYDEDIKAIIKSEGLIVLNLDERILGTKQKKPGQLIEYFSVDEFKENEFEKVCTDTDLFPLQGEEHAEYERHIEILEEDAENLRSDIERGNISYPCILWRLWILHRRDKRLRKMPVSKKSKEFKQVNDIKHLCNNIMYIIQVGGERAWKNICIGSDFDGLINPVEGCANATRFDHLRKELKKWLPDLANKAGFPLQKVDETVDNIMFGNANVFLKKHFT